LEGRNSLEEVGEAESFDGSTVEGREKASEDVIKSFIEMGLFDGVGIFGRGNNAKERGVSFCGVTESAQFFFHQAIAGWAGMNFCFEGGNESGKMF